MCSPDPIAARGERRRRGEEAPPLVTAAEVNRYLDRGGDGLSDRVVDGARKRGQAPPESPDAKTQRTGPPSIAHDHTRNPAGGEECRGRSLKDARTASTGGVGNAAGAFDEMLGLADELARPDTPVLSRGRAQSGLPPAAACERAPWRPVVRRAKCWPIRTYEAVDAPYRERRGSARF